MSTEEPAWISLPIQRTPHPDTRMCFCIRASRLFTRLLLPENYTSFLKRDVTLSISLISLPDKVEQKRENDIITLNMPKGFGMLLEIKNTEK